MGQKQIVRDLVVEFTRLLRPLGPAKVNDGFRLMTSQFSIAGQPRAPDPACMRRIDGFEFAFPATAGSNGLFDFLNDVFALTDEFYNNDTPMGFGMSLRITRGTTALIGMQQFARTAHVEFFFVRGIRGEDAFYDRLHNLAVLRGGIPHWGLKHKLNATRVDQIYGANVVQWRQSLLRIILGGGPNTRTTFRTTFSVDRNLEPPSGCVLPIPPVFLTSIDKIFGARKRADWLKSTFGKKGREGGESFNIQWLKLRRARAGKSKWQRSLSRVSRHVGASARLTQQDTFVNVPSGEIDACHVHTRGAADRPIDAMVGSAKFSGQSMGRFCARDQPY
jgi:hypothetical protein